MNKTFDWLTKEEQTVLRDFSLDAEKIVNELGIDMTEKKLFPFTPVGNHSHQQGVNKPWMPQQHEIISENSSGYVTIYCQMDSSFTKHESRKGILARVRKQYFQPEWERMVQACMRRHAKELNWSIYTLSNGTPHIYLNCNLPAVNGSNGVALYVPTEYFRTKDFTCVVEFHTRVAVGYYKGKGFSQPEKTLIKWQNMTAAALTCADAMKLRRAVEGRTAKLK